jgi:hypothetical protein
LTKQPTLRVAPEGPTAASINTAIYWERLNPIKLHGVTSQKTVIEILLNFLLPKNTGHKIKCFKCTELLSSEVKPQLFLCLIKYKRQATYDRLEVQLHTFLALDEIEL